MGTSCQEEKPISKATTYWDKISVVTGLQSDEITDMISDRSGNLWAAFAHDGIGKFDGSMWTIFRPVPVGMSRVGSTTITYGQAIFEDSHGNIWASVRNDVGTYACRFDGQNWVVQYLQVDVLPAIVELKNGNIWYGSYWNPHIFDGSNWTGEDCGMGLCYRSYSAVKDKEGVVWIGGSESSVLNFDGTNYTKLKIPVTNSFTGDVVEIIEGSSDHILVASSGAGVWKLEGNSWKEIAYPRASSVFNTNALSVLEDSKGRIWIGTDESGVFLIEGSEVTNYKLDYRLNDVRYFGKNVTSIIEDKNGKIWLSNIHGLYKFEHY